MTGHFLKSLVVFSIMIILGLAGVILLKYMDRNEGEKFQIWNSVGIAK